MLLYDDFHKSWLIRETKILGGIKAEISSSDSAKSGYHNIALKKMEYTDRS
jgi:hypothetical protein